MLNGRQIADLVQEQGATVGHLETADAVGLGIGKRTLDVAKELAFENSLGQPAGVDRHQSLGGTGGDRVK